MGGCMVYPVENYLQMCNKYPEVSRFIILKINAQRRGITFSSKALAQVDKQKHQVKQRSFSRESNSVVPVSIMLRDGTSIVARPPGKNRHDSEPPLLVDLIDDKLFLSDSGIALEEVSFWEKPLYYEYHTSSGKPMWQIASARPQRLDINPYQFCDFWKSSPGGCKFCEISSTFSRCSKPVMLDIRDITETVSKALEEKGRYSMIMLTGGANLSGDIFLNNEVYYYAKILKEIGGLFSVQKFPSQLLGLAYTEEQLKYLYEETGLMSFTANLEVLDKELFKWICPGKSKYISYELWKERLYQAVDIFGKGYVNTGIVGGVEFAAPFGYTSEDIGLERTLREAEELMQHGVSVVSCVWRIAQGSIFCNQKAPSLEYYIRLSKGLDILRRKYGLVNEMDDYRRCGNHPDTDLGRI